jgi:hypothetical protein
MAKKTTVGRLKKAKRIREAGLQAEREFFGKGGLLEVKNPFNEVDYMKSHGWDLIVGTRKQPKVYSRTIGSDFQTIQKEARYYRLLNKGFLNAELQSVGEFPLLTDAIIRADKVGTRKELFTKNPTHWQPPQPWEAIAKSKWTKDEFILSSDGNVYAKTLEGWVNHGSLEQFTKHAKEFWKPLTWLRNPITVVGLANPPRSVHANIEGIVYNRCIQIKAEKTGYKKGFYKHPFSRGSQVCIYALDNGDLLIHSKAGVKLWQPD